MPERSLNGASVHPDVETLAAYVDGTLEERPRGDVEAHIAECEDCYELVTEVMRSKHADVGDLAADIAPTSEPRSPSVVVPFTRRRWVVASTVGLAAAAALLLVFRVQPDFLSWSRGPGTTNDGIAKL